jgi:hypothetical protein
MIRASRQGLVVEDKDKRVANYVKAIVKDVETIAHSVGVSEPRKLTRRHVRIVQDDGRSIPMDGCRHRRPPRRPSRCNTHTGHKRCVRKVSGGGAGRKNLTFRARVS